MSSPPVRYAFLCDFDGTISPCDIGARFLESFSPGMDAERRELKRAWNDGTIGSRELTEAECRMARVLPDQALAFIDRFEIDPDFAPFVGESQARGDLVLVVSDGFEFYIERLLARAGIAALPRSANRLEFRGGRVVPEFPNQGRGCGRCGNCKGDHARRAREEGFAVVVVVGDGLSDRCAAQAADRVLARGALAGWCRDRGIASHPFRSFADVARFARALPGRDGSIVIS